MSSARAFFGTDGIRGTVGQSPITADFMLRLGHAVGRVLKASEPRPTVLIGKDTRISGYMIESALEAGFASAGVDVLLTGPLPTPGVAYLTRALRLSLGVVISASHNPFGDNGIKFFSARGEKLPDAWEQQVESALDEPAQWVDSAHLGKAKRIDDACGRYIEFCKGTFSGELSLKGLKIVVDAAHGAAYHVAPDVFHELGAEVIAIGCSPNGTNINAGFGATAPAALVAAVKEHGAHYGVALDGDADRLQLVDAAGRLYNGDELLYLMVTDRLAQGLPVPGAVGTLMTNMAVEVALRRRGVAFVRAKVGDRYVLEELTARGWQLGGAAGAAGRVPHGPLAGRPAGGRDPVSSDADQRAPSTGRRLEVQRAPRRGAGRGHPRTRRRRPCADPTLRDRTAGAGDGRGARRGPGQALRPAPGRHARLNREARRLSAPAGSTPCRRPGSRRCWPARRPW
jgi:phosphoglucosamine mutase